MATKYPATWAPGGEFGFGTIVGSPLDGERHITLPFGFVDALHPAEGGGHGGLDEGWYTDDRPPGGVNLEPLYNRLFGVVIGKGFNSVYGNFIFLRHGDPVPGTIACLLMHLAEPSPWNVGDFVPAGQVLGRCDTTGLATGPHLHWGMYVIQDDGSYKLVDPLSVFGEEPAPPPPVVGGEEQDMKVIRRMDLAFAAVALEAAKLDLAQGQGTVDLIDTGNDQQVGVLMIVTRDELLRALPGGI